MQPREKNRHRVVSVQNFLCRNPETPLVLRRCCLCLRLAMVATRMCGCKLRKGSAADEFELGAKKPPLFRLACGEVATAVHTEFCCVVREMHRDPSLAPHLGFVLECLLVTAGHITVRFKQFQGYPTAVLRMSRLLNPSGYFDEMCLFLHKRESELDKGYSMPLQRSAWEEGGHEMGAMAWLCSDRIQAELDSVAMSTAGSTLDVERKHALDKQSERRRAMSCAVASRSSILRRWRIWSRSVRVSAARGADVKKKHRKAKHSNLVSVALARHPDLFPRARGRLHWQLDVNDQDARSLRAGSADRALGRERLREYIENNRASLEAELAVLRDQAERPFSPGASMWPPTKGAWLAWLDSHEDHFRATLRACREGRRRSLNHRLDPEEFPDGALRVRPAEGPAWCIGRKFPCAKLLGNGFFVIVRVPLSVPVPLLCL